MSAAGDAEYRLGHEKPILPAGNKYYATMSTVALGKGLRIIVYRLRVPYVCILDVYCLGVLVDCTMEDSYYVRSNMLL